MGLIYETSVKEGAHLITPMKCSVLHTAVSWAICLVFSPLVGSLVASVLMRLVWARASEYLISRGSALPESGSSPIATADGDRDRDHGDQPPCTNPANCIDPMDAVPRGSFSLCIQSTRHPQGAQWFSPSPSPSFCLSPSPFLCKLNWYYYCDRQCC